MNKLSFCDFCFDDEMINLSAKLFLREHKVKLIQSYYQPENKTVNMSFVFYKSKEKEADEFAEILRNNGVSCSYIACGKCVSFRVKLVTLSLADYLSYGDNKLILNVVFKKHKTVY